MFSQYLAAEWVNFAEGHSFKTARALEAQAKPAKAAKQIKNAQLIISHFLPSWIAFQLPQSSIARPCCGLRAAF